jgi:hypothetical protein
VLTLAGLDHFGDVDELYARPGRIDTAFAFGGIDRAPARPSDGLGVSLPE